MKDYFEGDPRSHRERMLAGDMYIGGDPENEVVARKAVALADAYHRAEVDADPNAREILAELVGALGEDSYVKPPLYVDYGENIFVGDNSVIGAGSVVTKNIPANVVAVGNPARVLREIGPQDSL